jgi:hypothetical protein
VWGVQIINRGYEADVFHFTKRTLICWGMFFNGLLL